MRRVLRIGLTGGLASGKTTISRMFESLGVPVIDADEISRKITRPGMPAYRDIIALFGADIVNEQGELRRDRIKESVFSDMLLKEKLEKIVHPRVRAQIEDSLKNIDYPYCLLSIPLLLEAGSDYQIDRILVVDTPVENQIERAIHRDSMQKKLAESIIASQSTRDDRLARADDIIDNSGDLKELENQVTILHRKYLDLADSMQTGRSSSS